ncbi:MAG TPA: lysoplasmalogenase [Roseiflexaceae bacterium]|nr:lysoplasmalogenase [Roseiflexaceae bacterium]
MTNRATSDRSPRRAAFALFALTAALLLLGLALGRPDARRRNRIPLPVRMLSSALVLAAALLLWKESAAPSKRAAKLVAAGMSCGLLGDLLMAQVIPLPRHVIWGMLAFGAGHTFYIRALLERSRQTAGAGHPYPALGTALAITLAGWWALVRNPEIDRTLNYSALAYSLLLASMSGLAASLAVQDNRYLPVAGGGALFLASDTLLASELFRKAHFPGIGDVIWMTYIVGQALIVGGMGIEET